MLYWIIYMYSAMSYLLLMLSIFFFFSGWLMLLYNKSLILEVQVTQIMMEDMKFYFFLDWVSSHFIFIIFFISSMVMLYSKGYMEGDSSQLIFINLTMMFIFSMFLMVLSTNIIMIFVGWDGLGLVSYCLVIYYKNEYSNYSGLVTIMINRLGDVMMVMSVIFFLGLMMEDYLIFNLNKNKMVIPLVLLMVGALTKSAQLPFSVWLPLAMAAPTPISSLVHSSTLVTAGIYLMIRFSDFFIFKSVVSMSMFYISVMTMFMSGLSALVEMDLKKVVAYSTLSQLGLMMMILFLGYKNLAFFHLLSHALFKAMLFMCVGTIIHFSKGNQDMRNFSLIGYYSKYIINMTVLASLSLGGFPFLSGFYSKDVLLECLYNLNINYLMFFMVVMATFLTVAYSFRLVYYISLKSGMGEKVIGGMEFNNYIFYPILLMGSVVIIYGGMMMWLVSPYPIYVIMMMKYKMINLLLFFLAFLVFYCYFIMMMWESTIFGNYIFYFCGMMWYVPYLQGSFFNMLYLNMNNYMKMSEQGWLEYYSFSLMFNLISKLSINLTWLLILSLKSIVMMFLFFSLLVLIL